MILQEQNWRGTQKTSELSSQILREKLMEWHGESVIHYYSTGGLCPPRAIRLEPPSKTLWLWTPQPYSNHIYNLSMQHPFGNGKQHLKHTNCRHLVTKTNDTRYAFNLRRAFSCHNFVLLTSGIWRSWCTRIGNLSAATLPVTHTRTWNFESVACDKLVFGQATPATPSLCILYSYPVETVSWSPCKHTPQLSANSCI